jgi:hypothetical protein
VQVTINLEQNDRHISTELRVVSLWAVRKHGIIRHVSATANATCRRLAAHSYKGISSIKKAFRAVNLEFILKLPLIEIK